MQRRPRNVLPFMLGLNGSVVHIVQSGFIWPYFSLSPALLSTLGLAEASMLGHLWLYNETDFMDWVAVDVGHMIEVQQGQRILLKDQSIRKCIGFQKCLDVPSHSSNVRATVEPNLIGF